MQHTRNAILKYNSSSPTQDYKYARGYWRVYDALLDHFGTDIDVCELGVGNGVSHLRWSYAVTGRVIGLELDDPLHSQGVTSKFTPDEDNKANPNAYANYQRCQKKHKGREQHFDIRYGHDAFDPENAQKVTHDYPYLKIIVNDSKHRPYSYKLFQDAWQDHVNVNSVLIQEDIGRVPVRSGFEMAHRKHVEDAIKQGWRVFCFKGHTEFNTPEETHEYDNGSLIGVKYLNNQYDKIFEHLKMYELTLDNIDELLYTHNEFKEIMAAAGKA